jgi:hypothetical protein
MKQILSLDPGGTTGYCFIVYNSITEPIMIESGEIPNGHQGFIKWWRNGGLEMAIGSTVVCESFTLRQGIPGVNLEPCYVMGALEALTRNQEVVYQRPTYKAYCDNDALKRLGMYLRGQQHARDAVRHAIAYLRLVERHEPTYRLGWPETPDKLDTP